MEIILAERYIIQEKVGEGSYSIVYKGWDREKNRRVAIKELKKEGLGEEEFNEAHSLFFREIKILKKLSHPSIPTVYDFIVADDKNYMIMQWIEGKSLASIIEEEGKIDEARALDYMDQIAGILEFLQKWHIVYKDLKPSNIIITSMEKVKIIDFGISRYYSPKKKNDTHILGTPGYAAPEAYTGVQTDMSADIYSLGATFYHAVTGQEPFQFKFNFPDPREFTPGLSENFSRLLTDCLKNREERIRNAAELKWRIFGVRNGWLFWKVPLIREKYLIPTSSLIPICLFSLILYGAVIGSAYPDYFNYESRYFDFRILMFFTLSILISFTILWWFSDQKVADIIGGNSIIYIYMIIAFFTLTFVLMPNFLRSRCSFNYTSCQSNMKNMGAALEMYADDHNRLYPDALSKLTPDYLKIIPTCSSPEKDTYSKSYRVSRDHKRYTFYCSGENHGRIGIPENYPQYTSVDGLFAR